MLQKILILNISDQSIFNLKGRVSEILQFLTLKGHRVHELEIKILQKQFQGVKWGVAFFQLIIYSVSIGSPFSDNNIHRNKQTRSCG